MLEIKNVSKTYQMGDTTVHALKDVTLTIEDGDFVAIMGPSGSGKSTLMHLMGLLDVPSSGSYRVNGREVAKLGEEDLAVLRRKEIGFIFQQFNLLPRQTALENVAMPELYSQAKPDFVLAEKLLTDVGLGTRLTHKTNELSGGQQQRVAIARALINQPRVILADEPTGNLDSQSESEIMAILKKLNAEGITVIIVTHEDEIGAQARRRIRMRDGVIHTDERLQPKVISEPFVAPEPIESDRMFRLRQVFEHLRQGFKTLGSNKVRTGLSMLGILIGVAAVVAMLAIGTGAQEAIKAQLSSLGSNLLVLRSGTARAGGVAQESGARIRVMVDDAKQIATDLPEVKSVSGTVTGRGQIQYASKNWNTSVQGSGTAFEEMHTSTPQIGRFFTEEENQKRARVAVIGTTVVREVFGEGVSPIGEMIKINKVNFQVIGVLPAKGASGFRDQDDQVIVPVLTAMYRLFGKTALDSIEVEMNANADMNAAQDNLVNIMTSRHKIPSSQTTDAFNVFNMAEIQDAVSSSSKTLSLLLASIAAISLLVGGVGIMNIMLVSVTERTREIGLRKAVGARPGDILLQFLIEAVVVSAFGGTIGIFIGWLITVIVAQAVGWATSVSAGSVILSFMFSAGVGVVFGIYPARKASNLNPIEALRYE